MAGGDLMLQGMTDAAHAGVIMDCERHLFKCFTLDSLDVWKRIAPRELLNYNAEQNSLEESKS